ncbi:MAG: homocysteine biosynthesis protein [Candidatus Sabulitectum sp.]|nr:homocysteine biosynthesis protein [Candidatus Sabulitectum sp.]
MPKSIEEINKKIKNGSAVVLTAGEMTSLVAERGTKEAAKRVDVVTTGTFGPMCSSGLLINTGHSSPRINFKEATLNGVPAYCGIAAVDLFLGATARSENPLYGGAHVIEDLVSGRTVCLDAEGHGTDCYPRRELRTSINLSTVASAELTNFRNSYQNYNVAVNRSESEIRTYLGVLKPNLGNAGFSGSGEFSPLINDPYFRTIGTGTKIFLGGGTGWITGPGTQHCNNPRRGTNGVPMEGAGTISVRGDLKWMSPRFLRGLWIKGYGVSLSVGVGIPIPILDEEMARFTGVSDNDILAPVVDYSKDDPELNGKILGHVSYRDLYSGEIIIHGIKAKTFSLSSRKKGEEIAGELKNWIEKKEFLLTSPAEVFEAV